MDCLHTNARPDERFHLQEGQPVPHVENRWWGRRVWWSNIFLPDGSPGKWETYRLKWNAAFWYTGNVKCDGTRTYMFQHFQMCPLFIKPRDNMYVMTTTPKEMFSVRMFSGSEESPVWNNMGGS